MKNILFLSLAKEELSVSVEFYAIQQSGLGKDFLNEVQRTLNFISRFPQAWPMVEKDVRRCLINRFPYGIFYTLKGESAIILAVANFHRRPNYWKKRKPKKL